MLRKTVMPMPPAMNDERPIGLFGKPELPLRLLDLHRAADGKLLAASV